MSTLLTPVEVAATLKVNIRIVYKLIRQRRIPAAKVGRALRILECDVSDFLDRSRRGVRI